jgi:multicopper oxidase
MTQRTRRLGLFLALATGSVLLVQGAANALPAGTAKTGMLCTNGPTFNLATTTGSVETPDANSVFMWGYTDTDPESANHPTGGSDFQTPGPVLCVNQGDIVTVNLSNTLPEPVSIVFPGQEGVSAVGGVAGLMTNEAPTSGTVSYTFTASHAGTYLYESGSDPSKQVEMGLYGALVVRPTGHVDWAYGNSSTRFDPKREYLLLLNELDPDLHHAVETGGTYDFTKLHNRYYSINGRQFPDTIQDNDSSLLPNQPYGALVRLQPSDVGDASQNALIRMINAGALNHPFHPHGNHTREIAQDGRLILGPGGGSASSEHFGETIGSGQTKDYLLRWDVQATDTAGVPFNDNWNPNTNPLPVAQPNYRSLLFVDPTFYSGNPYLGYKGTLPAGTSSLNVCGEWYFPFHSHALDEFTNFDEAFGGMGTLLRVDPRGGCFTFPASTNVVGGVVKSGSVTQLGLDDGNYYQVNPKTTTRPSATNATQTSVTVASATGFPNSGTYYVRIDSEVLQVIAGQGTTTWTVSRGQLGTTAASHAVNAVVTALADDWYGGFTGVPAGAENLKVRYKGKNCGNTTGSACTTIASNPPAQTVKICNWTIAGAAGCSSLTSSGWQPLPAPPAQPQSFKGVGTSVGSTDVDSTWTLPGPAAAYVGTGSSKGQVRVLVHTQRWTAPSPTSFSTWGNLMKLVYDAP